MKKVEYYKNRRKKNNYSKCLINKKTRKNVNTKCFY